MTNPALDRLMDESPEFKAALEAYQAVYATGDAVACAVAWERCLTAANAHWEKRKREKAA